MRRAILKSAVKSVAVTLLIGYSTSVLAEGNNQGLSYPGSAYQVRKSTLAAKKMTPVIGKSKTINLSATNPYEARRIGLVNKEEQYRVALEKWEAKVEAQDRKLREKQIKDEERRQKELKRSLDKKTRLSARASKAPEKRSYLFGVLGGSSPKTQTVKNNNLKGATSDVELASLPTPNIPQVSSVDLGDNAPKTEVQVQENPGFFTRLKWAIFGR